MMAMKGNKGKIRSFEMAMSNFDMVAVAFTECNW